MRERPDLSGAVTGANTNMLPCGGHIGSEILGVTFGFFSQYNDFL